MQLCQNYKAVGLVGRSGKVMLKVILNRLKPQAGEMIAEERGRLAWAADVLPICGLPMTWMLWLGGGGAGARGSSRMSRQNLHKV